MRLDARPPQGPSPSRTEIDSRADVARPAYFFWFYVGTVVVSLIGSLASSRLHLDATLPRRILGPTMLVLGGLALLDFVSWKDSKSAFFALGSAAFGGSMIELAGVTSGLPFGWYHYTGAWFPSVALAHGVRFPPLVAFAWLMIAGGWSLGLSRIKPAGVGLVIAAALAAATDMLMEPVTTGVLGYWTWDVKGPLPGGVPISNLIGWFLAALAVGGIVRLRLDPMSKHARPLRCLWIPAIHLAFLWGLFLILRGSGAPPAR